MENEFGMTGALIGATITVVGLILVMFPRDIQERKKENLDQETNKY